MIFFSPPWTEGLRRGLPIVLGYLPVGFAFGILAVKNGIPPSLAVALAVLMFSGSGQFVFASMWGSGASPVSTGIAVGIVNLRYLIMSAAEVPWLTGCSRLRRFFLGLGVTDETFVVHAAAIQNGWQMHSITMFVCNGLTHISWICGCAIGAFCGNLVNDAKPLGLDYALTAMFIALLIPQCSSRLHVLVAIFSLCVSIALRMSGLTEWNIAIATICGATLGLILDMRNKHDVQNDS